MRIITAEPMTTAKTQRTKIIIALFCGSPQLAHGLADRWDGISDPHLLQNSTAIWNPIG
jgi:hypothetical protein